MPRNMINEIGNRYGKLAVIECAGKHKCRAYLWHCKCDCGNKTIVLGSLLRGGQVRSCGCSRVIEEKPGAKYGKLTVIGRSKEKGSQSGAYWRCKCDCGKEINVCGGNLRNGAISCGCSRFLPKGQAAFNGVFCKLRNAAKKRGYEMKLSKKQFKKLIDAPCAYCGVLPSNVFKNHKETYIYNGIDRIDSKKGYTIDNILSCCSDCNIAKLTKDISEFSEWFKRLIFYNKWDYHNINSVKFINIKFSGQ